MTFNLVLARNYPADRTVVTLADDRYGTHPIASMSEEELRQTLLVRGHLEYGIHERFPQPSGYITILRDPVDRVLSLYEYARAHPGHHHHRRIADGMTLAEFAQAGFAEVENGQTRQFVPGAESRALAGDDLTLAKRHLDSFLAVGLTERFDESVLLFRRRLGWKQLPLYRRQNEGARRRAAVDPEARRAIEAANELDRELYRHAQGLFDRQLVEAEPGFAAEVAWFRAANGVYRRVPPVRTLAVRRLAGPTA